MKGPLNFEFTTQDDCVTDGEIEFTVQSGTKPYLLTCTSPSGIPPQQGNGPTFTFSNLSEGLLV